MNDAKQYHCTQAQFNKMVAELRLAHVPVSDTAPNDIYFEAGHGVSVSALFQPEPNVLPVAIDAPWLFHGVAWSKIEALLHKELAG